MDKTPSKSALAGNIKALRAETLEKINGELVVQALEANIEKGNKIRVDCTVVESNIHPPTDSELLYERGIFPQTTYVFKHALTREVVYESILTTKRKNLHEEIGNAIEDLHKGNLYEHYEVLTEHYSEAENYPEAVDYIKKYLKKNSITDRYVVIPVND